MVYSRVSTCGLKVELGNIIYLTEAVKLLPFVFIRQEVVSLLVIGETTCQVMTRPNTDWDTILN